MKGNDLIVHALARRRAIAVPVVVALFLLLALPLGTAGATASETVYDRLVGEIRSRAGDLPEWGTMNGTTPIRSEEVLRFLRANLEIRDPGETGSRGPHLPTHELGVGRRFVFPSDCLVGSAVLSVTFGFPTAPPAFVNPEGPTAPLGTICGGLPWGAGEVGADTPPAAFRYSILNISKPSPPPNFCLSAPPPFCVHVGDFSGFNLVGTSVGLATFDFGFLKFGLAYGSLLPDPTSPAWGTQPPVTLILQS